MSFHSRVTTAGIRLANAVFQREKTDTIQNQMLVDICIHRLEGLTKEAVSSNDFTKMLSAEWAFRYAQQSFIAPLNSKEEGQKNTANIFLGNIARNLNDICAIRNSVLTSQDGEYREPSSLLIASVISNTFQETQEDRLTLPKTDEISYVLGNGKSYTRDRQTEMQDLFNARKNNLKEIVTILEALEARKDNSLDMEMQRLGAELQESQKVVNSMQATHKEFTEDMKIYVVAQTNKQQLLVNELDKKIKTIEKEVAKLEKQTRGLKGLIMPKRKERNQAQIAKLNHTASQIRKERDQTKKRMKESLLELDYKRNNPTKFALGNQAMMDMRQEKERGKIIQNEIDLVQGHIKTNQIQQEQKKQINYSRELSKKE